MSMLLVLNVVFAVVALVIGFVLGAWFTAGRKARQDRLSEEQQELERQKHLERERAAMATERLRDLASGVACDVGKHSSTMGEITEGLRTLDTSDAEATGVGLVNALSRIVAANEVLQERLSKAEEQIAAQAREIHLHESEARTDSLTGLANRRAFDEEMRRRCSEAVRNSTSLSLLIMDIDYFKKFNDTHGHQAGDEVLREFGRMLLKTCRDMDLPCRYGGEEFAVVMPSTVAEQAKTAAERIRKAIESMTVKFEGQELKVTTSVGLAQFRQGEDQAKLVRRADDALYASKSAGRNCGHWHDGQEPLPFSTSGDASAQKQSAPSAPSLLESLPNRTRFADELRRRMAEATRTEQPIAVLVVELDGFQDIRSRFGAEVAGTALEGVATVLQNSLREMDLLAQLSESRFAVMLPDNDIETAERVVSRASEALRQCPFEFENQRVALVLSAGKSQHKTGDSVEVLVGRAEADLNDPMKREVGAAAAARLF